MGRPWSCWAWVHQMTMAVLFGAGSGALHAVTGPDHVLSLGPVALGQPRSSWRIGLEWGVGHALGTLLLAVPLLLLATSLHLPRIAAWGDRLAGAALIGTAAWSWFNLRRRAHAALEGSQRPLFMGLIHGVCGAGTLVLVLPVLISSSLPRGLSFLAAFAIGSTVSMAALTWAISKLGGKLQHRSIARIQPAIALASIGLGTAWLIGA